MNWLLARKSNPNLIGGPMQQTAVHMASARQVGQQQPTAKAVILLSLQSGQSAQIVKILLGHSAKDVRLKEDLAGSIPLFCAIEAGNNCCIFNFKFLFREGSGRVQERP